MCISIICQMILFLGNWHNTRKARFRNNRNPTLHLYTDMSKKSKARVREIAFWLPLATVASSRNLAFAFSDMSVICSSKKYWWLEERRESVAAPVASAWRRCLCSPSYCTFKLLMEEVVSSTSTGVHFGLLYIFGRKRSGQRVRLAFE